MMNICERKTKNIQNQKRLPIEKKEEREDQEGSALSVQ